MTTMFKKICSISIIAAALLFAVAQALDAQSTGKISGTIKDKLTGEPLVGVNVLVVGKKLGAVTDENGFYYILRVPPDKYDLRIALMGYKTLTLRDVVVKGDLTVEMNVQLEQTTALSDEVTVIAEQKLIQKDITSTRRTISQETIKKTPGLESATDVFKLQAGAYLSSVPQSIKLADGSNLQVRDESLKDIHVRGGRGGEILYMVDGMPMTHPIYGGRSVIDLNLSDVESVELLTGAFSAEYGQAQSGVVNINTRSGGEKIKGGTELKSDQFGFLGESYNTQYGSVYVGGPEPLTRYILPELGIKLPGEIGFFVSANASMTNTPYDNHKPRNLMDLFGMNVEEKQDNTQNLNGKLNWDITGQIKLSFSYHGSINQWSSFNWYWKNYPDRVANYRRENQAYNMQFYHVLSNSTYYSINIGYLGVIYNGSWNGKKPSDFWQKDTAGNWISTISAPQYDPQTGFYDQYGYESIWRDDNTDTYTIKGDITSQVHSAHLLKMGVEVRWNTIRYIDIQDGGYQLSRYGSKESPIKPPGPFPEFGLNRWCFKVDPIIGSAYLQDKFELEYLIINAGFRCDWFSLGQSIMSDQFKDVWSFRTNMTPDWNETIYQISPRFGISFPISENTVIFFSYGHFNQLPELQYYYRDPYTGGFAGNPKLKFEQTILYEFGLTHQISQNWAIDIKNYAKDISNQVGTTSVWGKDSTAIALYDNIGYARARGLEFELTRAYANYISGKLNYTIQWTSGYSSSAFDDYVRSQTNFPNPIRERALSWDVRHQVIFQGSFTVPPNQYPSVFGLELPDDWNLTVLYRFSTGTPYTPGDATISPIENQKRENTVYGPPSSETDLKFEKGFSVSGIRMALTIDIFNLFDQKNIQMSYGFNTWTGKPLVYGDVQKPQTNFYDYYTMLSLMDPRQYSTGRTAKVGLRIDF